MIAMGDVPRYKRILKDEYHEVNMCYLYIYDGQL